MPDRKSKTPAAEVTDLERARAVDRSEAAGKPVDLDAAASDASAPESLRRWDGTMRVLVFATDKQGHPETSSPFVIIPDAAGSYLPQHPGGLEWRYFATMRLDDQLLFPDRAAIEAAFHAPGYYISHRHLER